MTDKELRKLKRPELIEILLYMRQEIDELRSENKNLQERLDKLVSEAIRERQQASEEPEKETEQSDE